MVKKDITTCVDECCTGRRRQDRFGGALVVLTASRALGCFLLIAAFAFAIDRAVLLDFGTSF